MSRPKRTRAIGFTLIETVTALAIASIILAGLGSVLAMSLKAFPHPDSDEAGRAVSLQDAALWFSDDLSEATSILNLSTDTIEFRVPDRDKDNAAEVIRYWWPGGSTALKRSVNGVETGTLGPRLGSFILQPQWTTGLGPTIAQSPTLQSDQTLLMVPGTGTTNTALGSDMAAITMIPVLDANATSWRPTSVRVMITTSGASVLATLRARLYSGRISDLGTQTPLATSASLNLSLAASNSWTTFTFASAPDIAPGTLVSVVIDAVIALGSVSVRTSTEVPLQAKALATGSGATWTYSDGAGAPLVLTGRQWRPTTMREDETRLMSVGVVMAPESSRTLPARFTIATPGEPVVK